MIIHSKLNLTALFCMVVLAGSFLYSCKKLEQLLTFSISNATNITISSSAPINLPFEVASPDVTTNSSQQFQNNNSSANLVTDIRLTALQLTITSPPNQTFAFLKSVNIYISTTSSNEILLASQNNVSSSDTTIALVPTQAQLDTYVKSSTYTLRTEIVTSEVITQDINVRIDSKFKVSANL